jgi:hypothetical protein
MISKNVVVLLFYSVNISEFKLQMYVTISPQPHSLTLKTQAYFTVRKTVVFPTLSPFSLI